MKRIILFTAIASVLATGAYAITSTVTSQDYVDTAVALKQNKIDATGANFTNGSVVETTSTSGVVTQRGIFNDETGWDDETGGVAEGHEGDLVTAGSLVPMYDLIDEIMNDIDNMPSFNETTVTYKTCTEWVSGQAHTDANCLLWNLSDKTVYGVTCQAYTDCPCDGGYYACNNGFCDASRGCIDVW